MIKTNEQLWKEMDALFQSILDDFFAMRSAMLKAIDKIQELEDDPDYGVAWGAQAILREALKLNTRTKEGWDV